MYTDYKIVEEREENGVIYQRVRYYEGDITTELEKDYDDPTNTDLVEVTRYRRTSMYEEVIYEYEAV